MLIALQVATCGGHQHPFFITDLRGHIIPVVSQITAGVGVSSEVTGCTLTPMFANMLFFEAWLLIRLSRMGIQWYHGLKGEGLEVFSGVVIVVIKKVQV